MCACVTYFKTCQSKNPFYNFIVSDVICLCAFINFVTFIFLLQDFFYSFKFRYHNLNPVSFYSSFFSFSSQLLVQFQIGIVNLYHAFASLNEAKKAMTYIFFYKITIFFITIKRMSVKIQNNEFCRK